MNTVLATPRSVLPLVLAVMSAVMVPRAFAGFDW